MLERDTYAALQNWYNHDPTKALLVDGARQIGKTYLIEQFAQREHPDYIKIDFLRDDSEARALASATSAQQAIEMLSLVSGKQLKRNGTLVFLDEIQEAQNLITLSKYLVEDQRIRLVMSGSLLGVELKHVKSLPVGYLRTETMFPLSFAEFCRAHNVPSSVYDTIEQAFWDKTPVASGIHERLISLFRLYIIVGGMPEAVQRHIDSNGDLGATRTIQTQLVVLYKEDIAKHAGERVLQVKAIYESLPAQLDKENKRFQFKALKQNAKFARYANDFAWITGARAALKTTNITDPRPMLKRSEEAERFKLYMADTGMLMSCYRNTVALKAMIGDKSVNFGGVYENAVAQEFAAARVPLHYYHNTKNGEVDFIVETDSGTALPIEVKSGKDYKRHVALNNLLRAPEYGIDQAYVLSEANVSSEQREGGTVYYLPLYMLPFVAKEAAGKSLAGVKAVAPSW